MSTTSRSVRARSRRTFSERQLGQLRRIVRERCRSVKNRPAPDFLASFVREIEALSDHDFERARDWAQTLFANLTRRRARRVDRQLAAGISRHSRGAA